MYQFSTTSSAYNLHLQNMVAGRIQTWLYVTLECLLKILFCTKLYVHILERALERKTQDFM